MGQSGLTRPYSPQALTLHSPQMVNPSDEDHALASLGQPTSEIPTCCPDAKDLLWQWIVSSPLPGSHETADPSPIEIVGEEPTA